MKEVPFSFIVFDLLFLMLNDKTNYQESKRRLLIQLMIKKIKQP